MENTKKKPKNNQKGKPIEKLTPEMVAMGLRKWLVDDKNRPKGKK